LNKAPGGEASAFARATGFHRLSIFCRPNASLVDPWPTRHDWAED